MSSKNPDKPSKKTSNYYKRYIKITISYKLD